VEGWLDRVRCIVRILVDVEVPLSSWRLRRVELPKGLVGQPFHGEKGERCLCFQFFSLVRRMCSLTRNTRCADSDVLMVILLLNPKLNDEEFYGGDLICGGFPGISRCSNPALSGV